MELDAESVLAQVDRLIRSRTFETSEVHRRLLQYLAQKTLSGEAERLKEYTIGLEAFAKPPEYDPRHDSIVRLQIGRLRQKLMAYYQTEAPSDPIIITIPKGTFALKCGDSASANGNGKAILEAIEPQRASRRVLILGGALVLVTLWAVLASVRMVQLQRETGPLAGRWSPELEQLWSPVLQSSRPLLVCIGTPLFVRFPGFGFFRDPKANEWSEISSSQRVTQVRDALGVKEILPWYAFTGAGEASSAFLLAKLLSTRKRDLLITRSSIVSWQEIVDNDLLFLGPPKFNLQLQAAPLTQDIVIEPNGVRNLSPQPGEPAYLEDRILPGRSSEGETHAVISRMPGISGVGEFVSLAGNASADTFAAAEWLTEPWRAKQLLSHLRSRTGELPRYYQVVLKVEFKQGIPVRSSYVFHHVLNPEAQHSPAGRR